MSFRATHQLLVADHQVGHFAPAHRHHVKAAVWLPAVNPQEVCGAAVQTATIRAEEDTPTTTGTRVRGQTPLQPARRPTSHNLATETHLTGLV